MVAKAVTNPHNAPKPKKKKKGASYPPRAFLLFALEPLSLQQTGIAGCCGHAFHARTPTEEVNFSVILLQFLRITFPSGQITHFYAIAISKANTPQIPFSSLGRRCPMMSYKMDPSSGHLLWSSGLC
jgi:hypothetical protein